MVNLVSGLTTIRTSTYYIVSQIGMFPMTIIIISLGGNIAELISTDVVSDNNIRGDIFLDTN